MILGAWLSKFPSNTLILAADAQAGMAISYRSHPNLPFFHYNVRMLETILRTKLYIPPLLPNLVPRLRLIERLNQGLHLGHKLTLISAPAGFGETTLVSAWD